MSSPDDPRPEHGADDPFDRPPDESGSRADQTKPIQPGAYPGSVPPAGESPEGYWERMAREQQGQPQGPPAYGASPYGQGAPPPPPPPGYVQPGYQPQGYAPGGYAPAGYGGYGYAMAPSHPSATTALVLGLVGLIGGFLCGVGFVVSPFALFVGRKAVREIDASNGQLGGRSNAKAGLVLGIIGTVLLALAVLAVVALVIFGFAVSSSPSYDEF